MGWRRDKRWIAVLADPSRAMTQTNRSLVLALFAIAMAHVEAALVVYLRELYYPDHPHMIFPLRLLHPSHLGIELARSTTVSTFSIPQTCTAGGTTRNSWRGR